MLSKIFRGKIFRYCVHNLLSNRSEKNYIYMHVSVYMCTCLNKCVYMCDRHTHTLLEREK